MVGLCPELRIRKCLLRAISEHGKEEEDDMQEYNSRGRYYATLMVALTIVELGCLGMLFRPGEARAESAQGVEQYRAWIVNARQMYPYPQSVDKMYRVMMCESGGRPSASGAGGAYLGLFQYAPATWRGGWNPYRNSNIWDAKAQIYATAKAWSIGMQGHWSCYYKTAGR